MRKTVATLLTTGAMSLALLTAACGDASNAPGGGPGGPGAGQAPQVQVAQVVVRDIAPSGEFSGSLTAPKSVELRPRVSGQIVAVDSPQLVALVVIVGIYLWATYNSLVQLNVHA